MTELAKAGFTSNATHAT